MPPLVTDGLRDCQIEAIEGLERSLARDDPRALIQMATGAGKTFTACTSSYRLLAHAGMRRILFLVDRRNLGDQTATEYAAYRPPGTGRLFPELYSVQKLGPAGLDQSSPIVISTIQRVYSVLTGKELAEEDEDVSAFEQRRRRRQAGRLQSRDPDRDLRSDRHRRMPPLDLRHVAAGAGIFRRLPSSASPPRRRFTRWASSTATSSPNIPTSGRWWTASTSASRSSASARASAKADRRSKAATPSRCATRRPAPSATRRWTTILSTPSASSTARSSCRTRSARCSKPTATRCSPNCFPAAATCRRR